MSIFLFQDSLYIQEFTGADKADKELIMMASKYHMCKVHIPFSLFFCLEDNRIIHLLYAILNDSQKYKITAQLFSIESKHKNVDIEFYSYFGSQRIENFQKYLQVSQPDHILISLHNIKRELLELLYEPILNKSFSLLVHASFILPFGPQSSFPNKHHHHFCARAKNIFVVSDYLKNYINEYSGLNSTVIKFPIMEQQAIEEIPYLGNIENNFITLVNPCTLKGIDIFLYLAEIFPNHKFAAVPGWGTTKNDLNRIRKRKNITVFKWFQDIDDLLKKTKVLLFPSICYEAFGLIIIEAMARGIPVLASDIGGVPEAKLGIDYILPVSPILDYTNIDNNLKSPSQSQNIESWYKTLKRLLEDQILYNYLSQASRIAGINYLNEARLTAHSIFQNLC